MRGEMANDTMTLQVEAPQRPLTACSRAWPKPSATSFGVEVFQPGSLPNDGKVTRTRSYR